MSEIIIRENLVLDDVEIIVDCIKKFTRRYDFTRDELQGLCDSARIIYTDDCCKSVEPEQATLVLISLGVYAKYGMPMTVSLKRYGQEFCGHRTAPLNVILKWMVKDSSGNKRQKCLINTKKLLPKDAVAYAVPESDKLVQDLREILLVDNWETNEGLHKFLLCLASKAETLVKQGDVMYYCVNKIGSIIINTGLFDKYGEYIRVMYKKNLTNRSYMPSMIMTDIDDYRDNDFAREDYAQRLEPICLKETSEVFNVSEEDVDCSPDTLRHCLEERRDRFPDSLNGMEIYRMAGILRQQLLMCLKFCKVDSNYAKQIYSAKTKDITWVLPIHVDVPVTEEPDMVICIKKDDGFWRVRTVLKYDSCIKDKIRQTNLYSDLW